MRCLIVIALCFVLANANWLTKNRFQKLLNSYGNQYGQMGNQYGYGNRYDQMDNLYGSDDVDDYTGDYVDEIRRERMCERGQCPRDIEGILGGEFGGEYDSYDMEDIEPGRRNWNDEDIFSGRRNWNQEGNWNEEGILSGGKYWNEEDVGIRSSPVLKEVAEANCRLTTRLYKQCKDEKDDKNTVVSPISVQLALAALNQGARGNTKRQIGRVIGGRLQKQERQQVFKTLIRHLKGLRNIDYSTGQHSTKINCVTGIFVAQTTRAQQQFIQRVKYTVGATVKHCPFSHKPQQCRQIINQWVAQKTQGKINHIVPQDAITDNTKMVLVNALQLKATWGPQMLRHVTKEAKFYPLDTKKVKIVEVLEAEGRFKYYEDELVKIVGLPTKEHELTLYTIVPKDKDGLTEVEKLHLQDSVQLKKILDKTDKHVRRVGVQLPKFQIKHKIDVRRTLRKQGVTDAFDPQRADFSGITGVSKYVQDEMEDQQIGGFDRTPFLDTEDSYEQLGGFGRNQFLDTEDSYETCRRNPFLCMNKQQLGYSRRNPFLDTESEYGNMNEDIMGRRETKLHLNKFIHQSTIKITENGITATTGSQTDEYEQQYERTKFGRFGLGGLETQGRFGLGGLEMGELDTMDEMTGFNRREPTGEKKIVKANRAFAFVVKHNPTNQLLLVGRVIDAAQKKVNNVQQTINVVDQF